VSPALGLCAAGAEVSTAVNSVAAGAGLLGQLCALPTSGRLLVCDSPSGLDHGAHSQAALLFGWYMVIWAAGGG
jgi:hypothetical protein